MLNELMTIFGGLPPEKKIEAMQYGTDALGKLGLTIVKIFGYFYEPKHLKQMADAEAYKRKQLADAKAYEIQKIGEAIETQHFLPLIYHSEDGSILIDTYDEKQLTQRYNLRLKNAQIQKEHNIESIIGKTALELEGKNADINEDVEKDWLTRYFNIAEDISDEDMQNLLAKILAGEILKPRAYSLRLLDFLHNTSKEELERILKIAPFVVLDGFIIKNDNILNENRIVFDDILFYSEIGILHPNMQVGRNDSINALENKHMIFYNKDYVCFGTNKNNSIQEFQFTIYSITQLGMELIKLANYPTKKDFFIENIKIWGNNYPNIKFSLFKVNSIQGVNIEYEDEPIIEIN